MNTLSHLLGYVIDLLAALIGSVLILRAWAHSQAIPTSDPIVRFCQNLTDWAVLPVSRSLKGQTGKWHWPALIAAFGIAILSSILSRLLFGIPISLAGLVLTPFALMLRWATELVLWGTVIWALLSWFQSMSPMARTLGYLVEPFLRPARRIMPTFRGFDLSPILVFLLCQAILIFVTPVARGFI